MTLKKAPVTDRRLARQTGCMTTIISAALIQRNYAATGMANLDPANRPVNRYGCGRCRSNLEEPGEDGLDQYRRGRGETAPPEPVDPAGPIALVRWAFDRRNQVNPHLTSAPKSVI